MFHSHSLSPTSNERDGFLLLAVSLNFGSCVASMESERDRKEKKQTHFNVILLIHTCRATEGHEEHFQPLYREWENNLGTISKSESQISGCLSSTPMTQRSI